MMQLSECHSHEISHATVSQVLPLKHSVCDLCTSVVERHVYPPPSTKDCIGIMYCVSLVMSGVYIILPGPCVELLSTTFLGW
jgi:hypothetical protein